MVIANKRVGYKRKELAVGDRIVLIKDIENGLLKLRKFDEGLIIHLQNQVKATVWFRQIGLYTRDEVAEALKLDMDYYKDGKMSGVVVELKRESFAIKHRYSEEFAGHTVQEDKAEVIPFFKKGDADRLPSNMHKNNGKGVFELIYQYYLNDVIEVVSDGFESWVSETANTREITNIEKENGEFPEEWDTCLTDESNNLFQQKKREVELAFAKATGIYYEFTGGLLLD